MDKVSICHACGRTIDGAYNFCPWCGCVAATEELLPERMDAVFEHVASIQLRHTTTRIRRMESDLGELEKELTLLLADERVSL